MLVHEAHFVYYMHEAISPEVHGGSLASEGDKLLFTQWIALRRAPPGRLLCKQFGQTVICMLRLCVTFTESKECGDGRLIPIVTAGMQR